MFKKYFHKLQKKIQKKSQPTNIDKPKKEINIDLKFDQPNLKNYNLKIITSYDENFNEIGKITSKSIFEYSKKYNFDCEILKMPSTGRPQSWNKIKLIKDEISKKKNEFIMWIDADAFFAKQARNILSVIEDNKEIFIINHYCALHKGSNFKNTILTINRINCGVMIFKASEFSVNFLEKIWNMEKYIKHVWWEQAAIMDLIGLKAEITGNLNDNEGDEYYLNKIKFLPKEWNTIPSFSEISSESIDPSIIHLAGIDNKKRLKFLDDYKKKGKL